MAVSCTLAKKIRGRDILAASASGFHPTHSTAAAAARAKYATPGSLSLGPGMSNPDGPARLALVNQKGVPVKMLTFQRRTPVSPSPFIYTYIFIINLTRAFERLKRWKPLK